MDAQQTPLRWWDRLNRAIFPFMGPAQLGPGRGGERPAEPRLSTCPLCGAEMSAHVVERTRDQHTPTRLICP
ncbi:hypothetical protein [Pseudolysinimonas sp.]|uniref:hypothetical protein n=1 Tax=Pseudolysinimonas sp. TaxID=2680009 RepID=UPI003F8029EB